MDIDPSQKTLLQLTFLRILWARKAPGEENGVAKGKKNK
jgi:hypothetical protein